jgi:hypothetical protein
MTWSKVLTFIFTLFGTYETDLTELEAGLPVTTPQIQVGSVGGKPLYASATLTTTKA